MRKDYSESVLKKEKYDLIKKYEGKTSKHSTAIIRTKQYGYEEEKKLMIRMIHGSIPTCEKINRIVNSEKDSHYGSTFYQDKYSKYTNEGLCPCCNEQPETVKHLFVECQNEQVCRQRGKLHRKVQLTILNRNDEADTIDDFYYTNQNQDEQPNESWDNYLGNMGLIPKSTEEWLATQVESHVVPYLAQDIARAIMEVNKKIWKYRCKQLYIKDKGNPT